MLLNLYSVFMIASKMKQDKQCTYNVTLRCFRATIVAVEKP
jgi:hypothetical protein